MNESILLRPYKEEDSEAIRNIIRETWQYDRFATPRTAGMLAKSYLYSCLVNQTFTQVAVIGGKPAGIIMGKNIKKYKCPLRYRIKQILSVASLLLSKEGRDASKIFANVEGVDKALLKNCETDYQGEIAFFAVDPRYRGHGIGKLLFAGMNTYMTGAHIKNFYLFTDTSCNYGFYEHQGMKRRQAKKQNVTVKGQTGEMEFYIYDARIGV